MVSREQKREAVSDICKVLRVGERKACGFIGLARSVFRHRKAVKDIELRAEIKRLALKHRRWGYRLIARKIRKTYAVNLKRIYRQYTEMGLKYRTKPKRKRIELPKNPLILPEKPGIRWSMDFMSDTLSRASRRFRIFNVIDDCSREALAQYPAFSIPAIRVTAVLDELKALRGLPEQIVVDNGSEFTSGTMRKWALENGVELHLIEKGKPTQNAFVESFNGKFRNECLNEHWFADIEEARREIEAYRIEYNEERPHSSLDGLTPAEFIRSIA